jgi:DedD protein
MEKKATRRIIGVLVVVALVIILLPLFNGSESQSNLQTAEVKAPPFPDPQNENAAAASVTVAQNNESPIRSWFSKVTQSRSATENTQQGLPAETIADKTVVTEQSTIQPKIAEDNTNAEANAGTITPPKQDTLVANSENDNEEDVEQGGLENVRVQDSNNTAQTETSQAPPIDTTSSATNTIAPGPQITTPQMTKPTQPQAPTTDTVTPPSVTAPPTAQQSVTTPAMTAPATQSNATGITKTLPPAVTIPAEKTTDTKPAPAAVIAKPVTTTAVLSKADPVKKPAAPLKKLASNTATTTPTQSEIELLKKSAWVVQLGSFKSKLNAERLTNALRAKGYKAFTFETKRNGQTRVYIGPEFKQSSATTIASRVQSDMKMHGIVLTYKPLEL